MGVRDAHPEKVRIDALELFKVSWQEADDLQQKLFSKFYACMIGWGGDANLSRQTGLRGGLWAISSWATYRTKP
ncbi:hypothetical protein LT42_13505 [Pseudomonas lutea]|jgi:hypothetical protein|uniref:Uncharacterized protein n=1 Tax=Pseudomonas lutea TaxID=243924 RepID=A0A9X0EC23_9PSED|nr:hypothetical protein LT42_13505 [Pseudomonas lutea]